MQQACAHNLKTTAGQVKRSGHFAPAVIAIREEKITLLLSAADHKRDSVIERSLDVNNVVRFSVYGLLMGMQEA